MEDFIISFFLSNAFMNDLTFRNCYWNNKLYWGILFYSRHDLYLHYILIKKLTIIFSLYINKFFFISVSLNVSFAWIFIYNNFVSNFKHRFISEIVMFQTFTEATNTLVIQIFNQLQSCPYIYLRCLSLTFFLQNTIEEYLYLNFVSRILYCRYHV